MISVFTDSPFFVDNVEFSGADGNVLRSNAIFLDGFTQQPVPVRIQGLYRESFTGMFPDPNIGEMPNAWRGSFLYKDGVDTAVYVVSGNPATDERIRIYHRQLTTTITDINTPGTLVYDADWPTDDTIAIDISDDGYVDGEVIEVTVQVYFPDDTPKTGEFFVEAAYTETLSIGSFPGLPDFAMGEDKVTAADLNQLSDAQNWIMNRLAIVPRVPFNAAMFALGTHKSSTAANNNPRVITMGWLNKGNGQDTLHGVIDYYSFNGQEYIKVYVNGVLKYTSPMLTNGTKGTLDFTADISDLSDDTSYQVVVWQEVVSGQGQQELNLYGRSIIATRFNVRKLEATNSRAYYTPSDKFGSLELMTFLEWKTRLNNFVDGTELAYNRINDNPQLFNRAQMFRRKIGWNRKQVNSLNWVNLPTQVRIGERFIVAGKDVSIAWGGFTLKKPLIDDPTARDIYTFTFEEKITGSDSTETKELYFDDFDGLFVGTQYYLIGEDISFFSEYLR